MPTSGLGRPFTALMLACLSLGVQVGAGVTGEAGRTGADNATWAIGFGAAATGGAGGPTVAVTTSAELNDYARRTGPYIIQVSGSITLQNAIFLKSNKTIVGVGSNPTISGERLQTDANQSNFIFRNLTFSDSRPYDSIAVRHNSSHVWIDHCTFVNAEDECIDISNGGDYVTISWCKFTFTRGTGQKYPILIGGSDGDVSTYHVTVHHNWFASGCNARMPRCRKGQIHVFSNYYDSAGNTEYCVLVALESEVLLENNFFNAVRYPWQYYTLAGQTPGRLRQTGNILFNCNPVAGGGNDSVFTPPYSYALQSADDARASVIAGVGPRQPGSESDPSRIVNLSVRTYVGTGENILIAGFVITGSASKTILVRGVGPTLQRFGVGNALDDPQLKVFDSSNRQTAENNDWGGGTDLKSAFSSVGAFPLMDASKDSALTAVLPPGSYTAHLSGVNGSAGVALVEVYEIP